MPTLLKDVVLDEVSLVDAGANPGAAVKLWKRLTPKQLVSNQELPQSIAKGLPDDAQTIFRTAFNKALGDGEAIALKSAWGAVTGAGYAKETDGAWIKKQEMKMPDDTKDDVTLQKRIDDAVAAAIAKTQADSDAAIKKAQEESAAAIKKAQDEASAATTQLAKMQDETKTAGIVAKLRGFTHLALKHDDLVPVLKVLDDKQSEVVMSAFAGANTLLAKAASLNEVGSRGGDASNTAFDEIVAKAAELRKSKPSMTSEQARAQVMKDNPDLYARYKSERRAAN